jgi:hypothetical protein
MLLGAFNAAKLRHRLRTIYPSKLTSEPPASPGDDEANASFPDDAGDNESRPTEQPWRAETLPAANAAAQTCKNFATAWAREWTCNFS